MMLPMILSNFHGVSLSIVPCKAQSCSQQPERGRPFVQRRASVFVELPFVRLRTWLTQRVCIVNSFDINDMSRVPSIIII